VVSGWVQPLSWREKFSARENWGGFVVEEEKKRNEKKGEVGTGHVWRGGGETLVGLTLMETGGIRDLRFQLRGKTKGAKGAHNALLQKALAQRVVDNPLTPIKMGKRNRCNWGMGRGWGGIIKISSADSKEQSSGNSSGKRSEKEGARKEQ